MCVSLLQKTLILGKQPANLESLLWLLIEEKGNSSLLLFPVLQDDWRGSHRRRRHCVSLLFIMDDRLFDPLLSEGLVGLPMTWCSSELMSDYDWENRAHPVTHPSKQIQERSSFAIYKQYFYFYQKKEIKMCKSIQLFYNMSSESISSQNKVHVGHKM